MQLEVLQPAPTPWYAQGLNFTCTQCGNCCTGPPGFVWITRDEIIRLAKLLQLTPEETMDRYTRRAGDQFSLGERRNVHGQFDCVFLTDAPNGKRACSVYQARPQQCRTWPFWPGNLATKEVWTTAAIRCHGMNTGKHFSADEINKLRIAD